MIAVVDNASNGTAWGPWLGLVVVFVAAPALAWTLRRLGCARMAIAAGLVVGVLLGPGIFGRIAPTWSLEVFHGPPELAERLRELVRERGALGVVASGRSADPGGEAPRLDAQIEETRSRWAAASALHRLPLTTAALVLAGLVMLAARGRRSGLKAADWSEAGVLAAWGFLVPSGILVLWLLDAAQGISGSSITSAALVAAAACAIGGWRVAGIERAIARGLDARAPSTVLATNLLMGTASAIVGAVGVWTALPPMPALGATLVLAAYPLGQVIAVPKALARGATTVALPITTALAALRIEPILQFDLWTSLVFYLLAEDGRWLAMAVGDRVARHRGWLGAMRIALVPLAAGPTMVAVATMGLVTDILPGTLGLAILLAAALIEMLGSTRLRVARQIEEAERQVATGEP